MDCFVQAYEKVQRSCVYDDKATHSISMDESEESIDLRPKSCPQKQIAARFGFLGLTVGLLSAGVLVCALETLYGIGLFFVQLAKREVDRNSFAHILAIGRFLAMVHRFVLSVLNPDFADKSALDFDGTPLNSVCIPTVDEYDKAYPGGIITVFLEDRIDSKITKNRNDKKFFTSHVWTRMLYFGRGPVLIAARIIDVALALMALPFSFVLALMQVRCLNQKGMWLHNLAYRGLLVDVIGDVFCSVHGMVLNPLV